MIFVTDALNTSLIAALKGVLKFVKFIASTKFILGYIPFSSSKIIVGATVDRAVSGITSKCSSTMPMYLCNFGKCIWSEELFASFTLRCALVKHLWGMNKQQVCR